MVKRGENHQGQGPDGVNVASGVDKGAASGIRLPPGMRGKGNL
jgi:dual specificity phosphatase 12